ncbi:MAG: hypothetical protein V9F46_11665 [Chitinophagaceae bacterium]
MKVNYLLLNYFTRGIHYSIIACNRLRSDGQREAFREFGKLSQSIQERICNRSPIRLKLAGQLV